MRIAYIIIVIICLGVFIATHELGHFTTAKLLGIKVNEFSIGMGPAFFKKKKGETLYSLRLFPVGGFCALEDENGDNPNAERGFYNQPAWKKIIVLSAGAIVNFLVGFLLTVFLLATTTTHNTPVLDALMDGFPYESEQGLLPGDEFLRVNGHRVFLVDDITKYLDQTDGSGADLVLRRDGRRVEINDLPLTRSDYIDDGELMSGYYGFKFKLIENPTPYQYFDIGFRHTMNFTRMVIDGLKMMVSGEVGLSDMTGVVGIVDTVSEIGEQAETEAIENNKDSVKAGVVTVLYFMGLIAVNLAVMNLLPIPALDGGHIFFIILNGLLGLLHIKKITPRQENMINAVCMLLLLILIGIVTIHDTWNIIMQ